MWKFQGNEILVQGRSHSSLHMGNWYTNTKHTDNKWENTSKALENIVFLKVACLTESLINKME